MSIIDPSRVNLLEIDIENYLYENPHDVYYSSNRHSVYVAEWIERQYQVPSGIIDLLGRTEDNQIAVVEIKNGPIDAKAIAQVKRYAYDIQAGIWYAHGESIPRVVSLVVGTHMSDHAMHECTACGVLPITFDVTLHLDCRPVRWKEEYAEKVKEGQIAIGRSEIVGQVADAYFARLDTERRIEETRKEQEYKLLEEVYSDE